MSYEAKPARPFSARIPGAFLLAFLLLASLWATTYFRAGARVRRATARVVALAEKPAAESPVALGLTANRFGKYLAPDAVLELEGYGPLASGRHDVVSLFAQIRANLDVITFAKPAIAAAKTGPKAVQARVAARYRLVSEGSPPAEGNGTADLTWIKGHDGWQIVRATLHPDENQALPKGWP